MDIDDESFLLDELLAARDRPQPPQPQPDDNAEERELFLELLGESGEPVESQSQDTGIQGPGPGPEPELQITANWLGDARVLCALGSNLQRRLFRKLGQAQNGRPETATSASAAVVTEKFIKSSTVMTLAAAAEGSQHHRQTVQASLERVGCVAVYGAAFMLGSMLSTWKQLFHLGSWKPKFVFSKMKFDETPLKMKIQEFNNFIGAKDGGQQQGRVPALDESYRFAKILRVEWTLTFVTESPGQQHYSISIKVPTTMVALEKNSAECLVSAMNQQCERVPELQSFFEVFPVRVRIPTCDRFGANLKAERLIASHHETLSIPFVCDVRKHSSCVQKSLHLASNTLSGLVNLALALESAGSLNRLRDCLQSIFEESLIIAHTPPPDEESDEFQHRLAVYDLFLPLRGPKDKKRRFILQAFANGNIQSSEIVHHCVYQCCDSHEETLKRFRSEVTEALLPTKLQVLNRKSWTGADRVLEWAGLLHSPYQLLPRILMRFLMVGRAVGAADEEDIEPPTLMASLPEPVQPESSRSSQPMEPEENAGCSNEILNLLKVRCCNQENS